MVTEAEVHKKGKFSLSDIIGNVKSRQEFQKAGAIALFIGVVRGNTMKNQRVQKLEIEAYEEGANKVLRNICNDLKRKEGIVDVQIHHLLGEFKVGDDLVYVSVAGSHRSNVFPVLEEAVDRYKKEVPIFKKEYVVDKGGKTNFYWVAEQRNEKLSGPFNQVSNGY